MNLKISLATIALTKLLFSLPINPVVLEGEIEFFTSSEKLELIANQNQSTIQWDDFSIAENEQVDFKLPSSQSVILNRMIGNRPSEIFGRLTSNGRVLLINPNGILFGPKSRIDIAALTATSFNLFHKRGTIQQAGKIQANQIELMADEIYLFSNSVCRADQILIGDRERTQFVWVDKGADLFADGFDGGRVLLLSQGMTDFHGFISATGTRNGGFVEVSGGHLSYEGFADVRGSKAGTLLLDPADINITLAVDAGNTVLFPLTFPLSCGSGSVTAGVPPGSIISQNQPAVAASSISVATLTAQIGMGHVIIDSTGAGAGTGNITWNAGANFVYTSPNDLILHAPASGNITILANVQNSGSGALRINTQGPSVQINTLANTQSVAFGSLNGATQICAPNANVVLQASNVASSFWSHIGYHNTVGGQTANGPIEVTCSSLTLAGSARTIGYALIGHGQMNFAANTVFSTSSTALLTVNVSGDLNLLASSLAAGAALNCAAIIGHGQRSPAVGSVFRGDLTVNCGGNITMVSNPLAGNATRSVTAHIGHGVNGTNAGTNCVINANVNVFSGGNITMSYVPTGLGNVFHNVNIGHFVATGTVAGTTTVVSGGTIRLVGTPNVGAGHRLAIGPIIFTGSLTGNTRIFACQDIILDTRNSDLFGLGSGNTAVPVIGDLEVAAGRDILFTSNGNSDLGRIGYAYSGGATQTRTFVAAGRNISLSGTRSLGIGGFGDVNVAAGGNITLTCNGAGVNAYIGTDLSSSLASPRTTRVYARGDINASNPVATGRAVIGRGRIPTATYTCSLDVRAGGDIQLSSPFTTNAGGALIPTSGSIFIEADSQFAGGSLWTTAGSSITSICGQTPSLPILVSTANATCTPTAFTTNSPSFPADARGAVFFDTGGNGGSLGLATTVGDITLHSAQFRANGALQDLTIGTGLNNVNLSTASGNIEIWGSQVSPSNCVRGDSFNNITIDQAITTTGSVFISANNNVIMTPASSINTSSTPVTLIVDNQAPVAPLIDSGQFIMDAGSSINTAGGLLNIYTALQNANTINGTLNGVFPFAPGTLFQNTNQEIWCSYFCSPLPAIPFTISYKNCLQLALEQAMVIVVELPVDLHPYNEFPGWMSRFTIQYLENTDPYYLRRRHLSVINHPKSFTTYMIQD